MSGNNTHYSKWSQLRNECLFFWVHGGMNRSEGQTNRVNREAVSRAICLFRATIHSPWTQKKRHSFLIFTMPPTKTLSQILREKLYIQNFHSYGHFTSFDVFITAHVIRPFCRTICWLCSSGIELKNFSRVQRRKCDSIVNISVCSVITNLRLTTICMHICHKCPACLSKRLPTEILNTSEHRTYLHCKLHIVIFVIRREAARLSTWMDKASKFLLPIPARWSELVGG